MAKKVLVFNDEEIVVREVGGEFDGLIYQLSRRHGALQVFIPDNGSMRIRKVNRTLDVNGWMVFSAMTWVANACRHIKGRAIGFLYPNNGDPFFNDSVHDYCNSLVERFTDFKVFRPQPVSISIN